MSVARPSRVNSSITFRSLRVLPSRGLVELEVHGPHDVGPDRAMAPTARPMPRRGFLRLR